MATKKKVRKTLIKKLDRCRKKSVTVDRAVLEAKLTRVLDTVAAPAAPPAPTQEGVAPPAPAAPRLSGLDAAAKILAAAAEPLSARAVVDRMLAEGLWNTKGKTPAATIYVAMLREMKAKGEASRFRMPEPGQFTAAAAG